MNPLQDVQQWLYHLGDVSPTRADAIAATNADLVVTEWASYANQEAPYTADRLNRMRGDTDKFIVSYLSIGEAETYRYYWDPAWQDSPPNWIDAANPEWIDNVNVRYWNDDWQDIILGYVDRIVEAGFDGVYLDLVSAYEYWEDRMPDSGRDFRAEMAEFVARIKAHAAEKRAALDLGGDFFIIGQNALELINNDTYLGAIDGIGKEDLQFYYEYGSPGAFETLTRSEYTYHLDLLQQAEDAGIATFVVEYVPDGKRKGAADVLHDEALDLGQTGTPIYVAGGRDLDTITTQPVAVMNGTFIPLIAQGNVFYGTRGQDVMLGTAGVDALNGKAGDDALLGGVGADILRGAAGQDRLIGGRGDDALYGGRGADDLTGKAGNDSLFGDDGADVLRGDRGDDRLFGGTGTDLLRGSQGNDALRGGKGADDLFGGNGADSLFGGKGGDVITGGSGVDTFVFAIGDGDDVVADFNTATDRLSLSGRAVGAVSVETGGLYLDMGAGDGIFLIDLTANDLGDIDFI